MENFENISFTEGGGLPGTDVGFGVVIHTQLHKQCLDQIMLECTGLGMLQILVLENQLNLNTT